MRLLLALLVISTAAWAQSDRNGPPSQAVQQQQKQADYARKQHPQSGKPHKQESKEVAPKAPKSKHGEATHRGADK